MQKAGYCNYDKSEFDKVGPVLEDDDALEGLWKKQYSLAAVTAPDQFKTYEDLEKRLKYVLGKKPVSRYIPDEEVESESEGYNVDGHGDVHKVRAEQAVTQAVATPAATTTVDSDEDDALSYFQKLADS